MKSFIPLWLCVWMTCIMLAQEAICLTFFGQVNFSATVFGFLGGIWVFFFIGRSPATEELESFEDLDPAECPHETFIGSCEVNKIEDAYVICVEISVECAHCRSRLSFIGIPGGSSFSEPRVGFDGVEARLPGKLIGPEDHREAAVGQYRRTFQ